MTIELTSAGVAALADLDITGFTQGSVLFVGATAVTEDNANLYWDDASNYLRVPEILSSSGTLTLGGVGNTNNENMTLDFESDSNDVIFSSTTSAIFQFARTVKIVNDAGLNFGSDGTADSRFEWSTNTNENLTLGLGVGSTARSGYFQIMEQGDIDTANRDPGGFSADPVLRIYSADATSATDYLEFYHDQTDAVIDWGAGELSINPTGAARSVRIQGDSLNDLVFIDGVNNRVGIGTDAPTEPLHVIGKSQDVAALFINSGTGALWNRIENAGNNLLYGLNRNTGGYVFTGSTAYAGFLGVVGAYSLEFGTSQIIRMVIDSAGLVGIGNTTPATALDVVGDTTLNSSGIDADTQIKGATDDNLTYWDAGNDRVGIGTATPTGKFEVKDGTSIVYIKDNVGNDYPRIYMGGSSSAISAVFTRITTTGDMYFGEDADVSRFFFRGTLGAFFQTNSAGTAVTPAVVKNVANNSTANMAYLGLAPHNGFFNDTAPYIGSFNDAGVNDAGLVFGTYESGRAERMRIAVDGTTTINEGLVVNNSENDNDSRIAAVGATNALFVQGSDGFVGILNGAPSVALEVSGDIGTNSKLQHNGDTDTHIAFFDDRIKMTAGIQEMFDARENVATQDYVNLGTTGSADIDVYLDNGSVVVEGSSSNVGIGTGIGVSPTGELHVDQSSTSGAEPVITLDQADVDEDYFKFIGTSDTNVDRALVDAADFTTPGSIVGWLKINVQDDQGTNPITDGDYYIPFYGAPSA